MYLVGDRWLFIFWIPAHLCRVLALILFASKEYSLVERVYHTPDGTQTDLFACRLAYARYDQLAVCSDQAGAHFFHAYDIDFLRSPGCTLNAHTNPDFTAPQF